MLNNPEQHSSDGGNQKGEKSVHRLQAPTLLPNFGPPETLFTTPGQIRRIVPLLFFFGSLVSLLDDAA